MKGRSITPCSSTWRRSWRIKLGRFFDLLVFHLARGYEEKESAPSPVLTAPGPRA